MRWATRAGIHIDRAACAWLLRRFIDPGAVIVLGRRSIVDLPTILIAAATLLALVKLGRRAPEPLLVAAAGLLGLAISHCRPAAGSWCNPLGYVVGATISLRSAVSQSLSLTTGKSGLFRSIQLL
jgi:hypothetical protein